MARVLWPAVKALSLDVTGTLLVHRHPIHETYAACALWAKLENPPSAEELKPAFKEAFRETSKSYPCFGHEDNLFSRSWWALVVKAALRHCGRNYADQDFDRFFRRVYQHYGTLDAYEELSDAKPFLDWARQQGLAIGVTTNSDTRTLDDVLPMLGFHDHLRWFVCGREVGSEKPEPWIFVETYRQANFWVDGIKREECSDQSGPVPTAMRGLIVDLERNEEEVGLNEGQHIGIDASSSRKWQIRLGLAATAAGLACFFCLQIMDQHGSKVQEREFPVSFVEVEESINATDAKDFETFACRKVDAISGDYLSVNYYMSLCGTFHCSGCRKNSAIEMLEFHVWATTGFFGLPPGPAKVHEVCLVMGYKHAAFSIQRNFSAPITDYAYGGIYEKNKESPVFRSLSLVQDWLEHPEISQEDVKAWTLRDLGEVKDLLQRSIIQQLHSSQTFALLKDLQGYTLYQCRVSALNGLGLSMASWIQARTLAVPPHQPGQPIVEEEWILDLEAYTVYYFTIAGLNEIGEGLKSEMVSAYTAPVGVDLSRPYAMAAHHRWGFRKVTQQAWAEAGLATYNQGDVCYMVLDMDGGADMVTHPES
eukprot:g5332.t2